MFALPPICRLAFAALVAGMLLPALAQACPTCKDQLASDANNSGLVSGFFWSILFMLATPALLATTWIAYVVYQIGEAEAKAEQNPLPLSPPSVAGEMKEARG
jgi:hypothetical protein